MNKFDQDMIDVIFNLKSKSGLNSNELTIIIIQNKQVIIIGKSKSNHFDHFDLFVNLL